MPLAHYCVGIGAYESFSRDMNADFGLYFHGHITIRIPSPESGTQKFESAIDVNKPDGGVQYVHLTNLDAAKFATVAAMADGFHPLASNDSSGALDYKRDDLITTPLGCLGFWYAVIALFSGRSPTPVWINNTGTDALDHLESMFATPGDVAKVYLFGEAFENPAQFINGIPGGVHDVHCNQGDPPGHFQQFDGIWQDGGVIVRYADGHLEGFFVKFVTQTLNTNDQGLPL
jgi:uncharacterized protein YukJ